MSIIEKEIIIPRRVCIAPAHVVFEDTGTTRDVVQQADDGSTFVETVAVKRKRFVDAVYEVINEKHMRYCIADGDEEHGFPTRAGAEDFLKWKGRAA